MTAEQIVERRHDLLRLAGILVLSSAALHVAAYVFSGFSSDALPMLSIAAIAAAIGWALLRGWNRLAWIAFFVALAGAIIAYVMTGGVSTVANGIFWLAVLANLTTAGALFLHIWRR